MPETKTHKQVRYLLSSVSPLSDAQRERLKAELHSREVKIKDKKKKK